MADWKEARKCWLESTEARRQQELHPTGLFLVTKMMLNGEVKTYLEIASSVSDARSTAWDLNPLGSVFDILAIQVDPSHPYYNDAPTESHVLKEIIIQED